MTRERSRSLREVAVARSINAAERARRALADLDKTDQPITFAGVAANANVSRQFLYSHHELRPAIEQLRDAHRPTSRALPQHERASDESTRTRLRAALDENKRLRDDLAGLRNELAHAHGRARELELAARVSRPR
jgi:hypothetical protein